MTAEEIAAGLTEAQASAVKGLCGNAWDWKGPMPIPVAKLNAMELLHVDVLKNDKGQIVRGKARPTSLGQKVCKILTGDEA